MPNKNGLGLRDDGQSTDPEIHFGFRLIVSDFAFQRGFACSILNS